MKAKILLWLVLLFAVIQLIEPFDISVDQNSNEDFFTEVKASEEIKILIHQACYDCHSNQTKLPWYGNIAPVSWWVKEHILDARKHLNFSTWSSYSEEKKAHKLEECYEEIEKEEMPLYSYTILHSEAQLSQDQIDRLHGFFMRLEKKYN